MTARSILAASVAVSVVSAASAEAPGAYAAVTLPNRETCVQVCEDDNLCMAWRFDGDLCSLRATAPQAPLDGYAGLSSRALEAGYFMVAKGSGASPTEAAPVGLGGVSRPETPPISAAGEDLLGGPEVIDLAMNGDNLK